MEQILTRPKSLILNRAQLNCAWRGILVSPSIVTVSTQIPPELWHPASGPYPFPLSQDLARHFSLRSLSRRMERKIRTLEQHIHKGRRVGKIKKLDPWQNKNPKRADVALSKEGGAPFSLISIWMWGSCVANHTRVSRSINNEAHLHRKCRTCYTET